MVRVNADVLQSNGSPPFSLSIWRDRLIFTARSLVSDTSARPSITVLIGAEGDVSVLTPEKQTYSGRVLLVGPDVPRALDAPHGLYSLNLDPSHQFSRALRVLTGDRNIVDLSDRLSDEMERLVCSAVYSHGDCDQTYAVSTRLLDTLFPEIVGARPIDLRINMIAAWLLTHMPNSIVLSDMAALCGLSPNRLTHLFTKEMGLPMRRYLLWLKMRKASELMVERVSLTDVAHTIGFSDSAHLTRVFKTYFALTPSFLANKALVRYCVCDQL